MSARIDVSPLRPTLTFHHCFGSAYTVERPVAAVRSMVQPTTDVHYYSLVRWERMISVYDEDSRHVVKALRWDAWNTEAAMAWFRSIHGTVVDGRKVQVTFKGRWA